MGPVGFVYADRFREAVQINRDLLSLKRTISALNRNEKYVHFKDSVYESSRIMPYFKGASHCVLREKLRMLQRH